MSGNDRDIDVSRDSIDQIKIRVDLERMLKDDGVIYQCDEEGRIITCYAETNGILSVLRYSFLLLSSSRMFIRATFPCRFNFNDKQLRKRIMKFVTFANFGMVKGAFEISREGDISFRDYIEAQRGILDIRFIRQSADFIQRECARYFPGITRVILEGSKPENEVKRCQKDDPYPFGLRYNVDKAPVVKHVDDIPMIAPSEEEIKSCLPFVT